MSEFPACTKCEPGAEGVRSPGAAVTDSCESLCGFWELNLGKAGSALNHRAFFPAPEFPLLVLGMDLWVLELLESFCTLGPIGVPGVPRPDFPRIVFLVLVLQLTQSLSWWFLFFRINDPIL